MTRILQRADADWNAIRIAMHKLGVSLAPLFELTEPPSWAVTLRFAMDVALPDVEGRCEEGADDAGF